MNQIWLNIIALMGSGLPCLEMAGFEEHGKTEAQILIHNNRNLYSSSSSSSSSLHSHLIFKSRVKFCNCNIQFQHI